MCALKVQSEIGPLKTVLIHNPGEEIDSMVPDQMQNLLFDDILFGKEAREEHDAFREILSLKARVLDIKDLLIEAISTDETKYDVLIELKKIIQLSEACEERLVSFTHKEFASALIEGIRNDSPKVEAGDSLFLLNPIPNLLFMRDPMFVIQDQAFFSSMFTQARAREPFLLKCILKHHSEWKTENCHSIFDNQSNNSNLFSRNSRPTVEGGDVLVLSEDVVCCGASQRTNRLGIESLAEVLRDKTNCKSLLVCDIVPNRAYMHLDTIFTQINHGEFLVYPRLIGEKAHQQVQVYRINLQGKGITYEKRGTLLEALQKEGFKVHTIKCGGEDEIAQQREQWTDASNAFALAPGAIVTYARNIHTADELSKAGYEIVGPEEYKKRNDWVLDGTKKIVFQIFGNELGRARGGPRCMTMPLEREW